MLAVSLVNFRRFADLPSSRFGQGSLDGPPSESPAEKDAHRDVKCGLDGADVWCGLVCF